MSEAFTEEDLGELRQEVALKHGVLLTSDDPVLVTVTLSRMVLEKYGAQASDEFEKLKNNLEDIFLRHSQESKDTANKLIGSALQASEKRISEVSNEINKRVKATLDESLAEWLKKASEERSTLKFDRTIVLIASLVSLVASLTSVVVSVYS